LDRDILDIFFQKLSIQLALYFLDNQYRFEIKKE